MSVIENISVNEEITLISLHGTTADMSFIANVFSMISNEGIDVDMISQSPQDGRFSGISFTVNDSDFIKVMKIAGQIRESNPELKISVSSGNSKISVYGEEMNGTPGVAAKVFDAVANVHCDIRMITTSDVTISLLVAQIDTEKCVEAIQKAFN